MKSLDTTIESLRVVYKNPKIMLILVLAYILSFIFISAIGLSFGISTPPEGDVEKSIFSGLFLLMILPLLIIAFLIYPIFAGMLISSGIQALEGKLSLSRAFEEAKKKYRSLLGVSLISIGIFVLLFVPIIFIAIIDRINDFIAFLLFILYLIFLVIALIFLVASLFEAGTIVFIENRKAFDAVKRGFYIGKKKVLSIIATQFFLFIIIFGVNLIIGEILGIFKIISNPVDEAVGFPILSILFLIIVKIPVNSFFYSAGGILPLVFYYSYDLKNLK
jgi:hypothetical protein